MPLTLYGIGYEAHTPDSFVEALQEAGIECVVDVRERPASRKKGFSKTPLSKRLGKEGIAYVNLKALGAPKSVRGPYKAGGSPKAFQAAYRRHLKGQGEALRELEGLAKEKPTAMLCLEADPADCHRSMISEALERRGWKVVDIGGEGA